VSFLVAGSGRSMSRLLYAVLVVSFSVTMLYLGVVHGVFNASEAVAIGTLGGGLAAAWGIGKAKAKPGATP